MLLTKTRHYLKTAFIESYDIHYDMTEFMYAWCIADDEQTCKSIINEAKRFDIFLGEFIKSILKINNIANELEKICEITENFKLLETVKNIPKQTPLAPSLMIWKTYVCLILSNASQCCPISYQVGENLRLLRSFFS